MERRSAAVRFANADGKPIRPPASRRATTAAVAQRYFHPVVIVVRGVDHHAFHPPKIASNGLAWPRARHSRRGLSLNALSRFARGRPRVQIAGDRALPAPVGLHLYWGLEEREYRWDMICVDYTCSSLGINHGFLDHSGKGRRPIWSPLTGRSKTWERSSQ